MSDTGSRGGWVAYRYEPSLPAAAIFAVLFFLVTLLHFYQLLRTRTWVFIPFVVGGFFEAIGYVGRILSANEPGPNWTLGPFIMQSLLLLIAPAFFAASIYMVLGRIILVTDGESHSLVRQKRLTKLFVSGDVFSFLLQSTGGGVMSTGGANSYKLGEKITIGGLIVQILVFGLFIIVAAFFHVRMLKTPTAKILTHPGIPWQAHLNVLYAASALILVRSVFRLIEYIQGNDGYLLTHEVYLYVFDAVLMFIVMAILAWWHPSEIYALLKAGTVSKRSGKETRMVKRGVQIVNVEKLEMSPLASVDEQV